MKTCSKCGEDHESKNYYCNKCRAMMAKVIREKHKANGTKPTPRSELRKFNYDDPNQYALFNGARGRARKNDIPFDIEPKDIIIPTHSFSSITINSLFAIFKSNDGVVCWM